MVGTQNFVPLIAKIKLLGSELVVSAPAAVKTQYFAHLSFYSTLKLINGISSDRQNYLSNLMAQKLLHILKFH